MSEPPARTGRGDRWGAALSTGDEGARRRWDEAVGGLVALAGDPASAARAALDADPGFAEARALCAYIELYAQTAEGRAEAGRLLAGGPGGPSGEGGASRGGLHLAAARAWAGGELEEAALHLEAALVADPHDLLALRVAQDLYFFAGDRRDLRDSPARVVRAW